MFDIKTGVIGVGAMGRHHARIYKKISNLVGVAAPDKKQGEAIASEFGATWYSDYLEMLDSVDAVTIAVPTSIHHHVASNVAAAGVNILVEKPLAGNVTDSKSIISLF